MSLLPYKPNKLSTFKDKIHPSKDETGLEFKKNLQVGTKKESKSIYHQQNGHISPINIFIPLIEKNINETGKDNFSCLCNACRADLVALSLKKLPAIFITDKNDLEEKIIRINVEYRDSIQSAINYSMQIVRDKPGKNCANKK